MLRDLERDVLPAYEAVTGYLDDGSALAYGDAMSGKRRSAASRLPLGPKTRLPSRHFGAGGGRTGRILKQLRHRY